MEKQVVIKIGTSVFMTGKSLDQKRIESIGTQIIALSKQGVSVVLVVSGAVAFGASFISVEDSLSKSVAAGIGQVRLTSLFQKLFSKKGFQMGQILLTHGDLSSKEKRERLKTIINLYKEKKYITIINENDVVDLNSFGGNDYLAGDIAELLGAHLIILSTMEGSTFGVGGGISKLKVVNDLKNKGLTAEILDGKTKDCLLQAKIYD